jgi:hypothetical protein
LFGKELEVGYHQTKNDDSFVRRKIPDGVWMMVPQWMTDERCCSSMKEVETPTLDIFALENLSCLLKSLGSVSDGSNDFTCSNNPTKGGGCEQSDTNSTSAGTVVITPDAPVGKSTRPRSRKNSRTGCRTDRKPGKKNREEKNQQGDRND